MSVGKWKIREIVGAERLAADLLDKIHGVKDPTGRVRAREIASIVPIISEWVEAERLRTPEGSPAHSPEGGKVAATPATMEAKRDAGVTVPPGDRQQSLASGLIPSNIQGSPALAQEQDREAEHHAFVEGFMAHAEANAHSLGFGGIKREAWVEDAAAAWEAWSGDASPLAQQSVQPIADAKEASEERRSGKDRRVAGHTPKAQERNAARLGKSWQLRDERDRRRTPTPTDAPTNSAAASTKVVRGAAPGDER